MGAGVSQKVMNGYYYRRLKKLQREFAVAGVPSQYIVRQLLSTDGNWRIAFNTLRASNGETCGMMHVYLALPDGTMESYGKHWDAEKGITRIKELFGKQRTDPYSTPEDAVTAKELGITVTQLREDRKQEDTEAL